MSLTPVWKNRSSELCVDFSRFTVSYEYADKSDIIITFDTPFIMLKKTRNDENFVWIKS